MTRLPLALAAAGLFAAASAGQDARPAPSPQAQRINDLIRKGYEGKGIKRPAARATDHEFLRRAFVDLIGRIPTVEEVVDFERDTSAEKRVKLVRRLLYDEDYTPRTKAGQPVMAGKKDPLKIDYAAKWADHWADIWTVWLMTRTGHSDYRDQMRVWLEYQFSKGTSHKELAVKLLTAAGTVGGARSGEGWPYKDDYAANFIAHHLGEATPAANRAADGPFDAVPLTSRVTRLFLGLQTQCTQCHDHPLDKQWVQADFWGVNAFFRQTARSATPTRAPIRDDNQMTAAAAVTVSDDSKLNSGMLVPYERRDGRLMKSFPVMLKDYAQAERGERSSKLLAAATSGKTRRQQLAEWVVTHDNFGRAYVNRVWAHFLGRGLNQDAAADDFSGNNPVVHPELLDYLAAEWAKPEYNYDPKRLMEWICTSEPYNLSHVAVREYAAPEFDPYFVRMPLKAMSPEVLFESLMTATRAEGRGRAARTALRDTWMRKLVRNFGDDEGNELSFNGTVVQALLMMNGGELNGEIGVGRGASPANPAAEVVRKNGANPRKVYDELFLMALGRHPTGDEVSKLEEVRNGQAKLPIGPTPPKGGPGKPAPKAGPAMPVMGANPGDVAFYQDVLWALLNTNEFILNH
ncbi:MAG: DUF1549 and DUF1553 domain-containing protein [Gemmataceae bacterium]|nr:DUF1549 and DUF1553 domain-containing protein [Gemmataceae bacterium]